MIELADIVLHDGKYWVVAAMFEADRHGRKLVNLSGYHLKESKDGVLKCLCKSCYLDGEKDTLIRHYYDQAAGSLDKDRSHALIKMAEYLEVLRDTPIVNGSVEQLYKLAKKRDECK